jgi:hypothetical protein
LPSRWSAFVLLVAVCASCRATSSAASADVDTLAAWMTGSFSSAAQAASGNGEHADVRMHAVAVFPERADGRWIYVERARAAKPTEPHWQRIVRLHVEDGGIVSDLYQLPGDVARFAGAWREPALLAGITPERASLREGCTMRWTRHEDGSFTGETAAGACPSELLDARSAMSTLTVTATSITSWDRGFDASGKQVWGPTSGPYLFARE